MYADLHMHTLYSDGTDTPREILEQAKNVGLSVLAITDHDCIEGSVNAQKIAADFGIKIIPGIELTTMHKGEYSHILGYNVNFENAQLLDYIETSTFYMTETTRINFENAKADGHFDYSWDRIEELCEGRCYIGGTCILKSMKHDSISPNISFKELFANYFSSMGKHHVKYKINTPFEAIDTILAAGGVPVLAHPKLIGDDNEVIRLIEYGAMGIEAYHPTNNKEDEKRYIEMAKNLGVIITGGTDWHGKNSAPYITHFGMRGLTRDKYLNLFND